LQPDGEFGHDGGVDQNTLTIRLFLFASALVLGVEAVKTEGRVRFGFGVGCAAFVLIGILWKPLAALLPSVASAMAEIAMSPPSWFFLIVVLFLLLREQWVRTKVGGTSARQVVAAVELDGLRADTAAEQLTALSEKQVEVDKRVSGLEGTVAGVSHLYSETRAVVEQHGGRLDVVALALRAINDRAHLARREAQVINQGDALLLADTDLADFNWYEWKSDEVRWREALASWLTLAELYFPGATEYVHKTPEEQYYRGWTIPDASFPDGVIMHRYKTYRIMFSNFINARNEVERISQKAAVGG
jgi:hypothetical protein